MESLVITFVFIPALLIGWRRGVFSTSFLISFHLFLGLGIRSAYLLTRSGAENILAPWVLNVADVPYGQISVFAVIYTCTLLLGYNRDGQKVSPLRFLNLPAQIGASWRLIWPALAAVAGYLLMAAKSFGGLPAFAAALASRSSQAVEGFGYAGILSDYFIVSASAIYFYSHRNRNESHTARWAARLIVTSAFPLLILAGGRGNLIQFFITLLIIRLMNEAPRRTKLNIWLISLPAVVLATTIGGLSARIAAQTGIPYAQAQDRVLGNLAGSLLGPFALVDHLMLSKKYAAIDGPDLGYQYLTNLVKPVPRAIWPEKPMPLGIKVRKAFWGDELGGIPPGVLGEAYIGLLSFGLYLAAAALGLIALAGDRLYTHAKRNPGYVVSYAVLAPYIAFNLVRGGVDVAFTRLIIVTFCLLIVRASAKKRFVLLERGV